MRQHRAQRRVFRFGSFEVDLYERKLTKMGHRIRLQEQPFRILALLIERPGELVTREEIRQKLWSDGVFVDFAPALNTAVRKLREALSDSADNPRFLETVPRQGYRFIAPVVPPYEPQVVNPLTSLTRRSPVLWVIAATILAGVAVGIFYAGRVNSKITPKDTIILADFANNTGDLVFDDTLRTALGLSLRQSPFFKLLSDGDVAKILQQMTRPVDTKLTAELARELCQRAGGEAYLAGSIGSLGSKYVVELEAVNCQNGDILAQEQATAKSKERVLDALGEASSGLRADLGEALVSVQKFDVPLAHATTSSLEALRAYSLGLKVFGEKGSAAALPYFQRATDLDPDFALGYDEMGANVGDGGLARKYFSMAFQLREHVSEWEKLVIAADYYLNVSGELDKAAQTYEQWIENYPRNDEAYSSLGVVYALEGQYEKASEITSQALRLTPSLGSYGNLASYALALQRFDEAQRIIREAQARKMDAFEFHNVLFALAVLKNNSAAKAEQLQWFAGKSEESFGLALASDAEAYVGHLRKARDLTRQAVDSAIRADNKENGAIWWANAALQRAAYGKVAEARDTATEALKLAPTSLGVEAEATLAFAMAGETARAEFLVRDLRKRFPLDTQMQSLWLPAIDLQLALDKKNMDHGLDSPQPPSPLELGQTLFVPNISCLYPVYVRGEAYLAMRQGAAAAAEFQKILDHSGIVWNCWTGALANLGLARARALESRTLEAEDARVALARSLSAYKDFLTLWEDADPDIPILKEAKTEYSQLLREAKDAAKTGPPIRLLEAAEPAP